MERHLREHQVLFNNYYQQDDLVSARGSALEPNWETLSIVTLKVEQFQAQRKELKRQIKKLKATLDKQEKSGHLDEARDRLKEVVTQVKTIKRELKLRRRQRDERQEMINRQNVALIAVHNVRAFTF